MHVLGAAIGERMDAPPLMHKVEALKLLGKKGGKGIYLYDQERKRKLGVNPEIQELIESPANPKLPGEIQDRLILLMVNEAARCMEEHVVPEPWQLDMATVFGIAFPPFRGGLLKYADAVGNDVIYKKLEYLSRVVGTRYEPCRLLKSMGQERSTFYGRRAAASGCCQE
jgi:3-hydroxyacyl-CoA dehydrogenase / enoyl-CoA hydratase / 3-hydroxybutyryl-CoA epimerase